jgi:hypothetical protein
MIYSDPYINDTFPKMPLWPPEANHVPKDPRQLEIEFFFPLTEQIPLDLDFTPSEDYIKEQRRKQAASSYSIGNGGIGYVTTASVINSVSLSVQPVNAVGQLRIGSIDIGVEKEPKWYQKLIYKLLGFNWRQNG